MGRNLVRRLLSRAAVGLAVILLSTTLLPAQHLLAGQVGNQKKPPILIDVDGEEVSLTLGENVHPQTYDLLSRDPSFASHPNVKWVFVDDMWVPVARAGYAGQPADSPEPAMGIDYIPECDITRSVPAYSQTGQSWSGDHLYDNPGCPTISQAGCALTSVAMVFRYFGSSTDPGQLNSCCAANGCYVGCGIHFVCAANSCSGGSTAFVDMSDFSWPALCGMLSQNRPPILEVNNGSHWVVVYKSRGYDLDDGSDYFINDPLDGSTYKRLAYYTHTYDPSRIVEYRAQ